MKPLEIAGIVAGTVLGLIVTGWMLRKDLRNMNQKTQGDMDFSNRMAEEIMSNFNKKNNRP